MCHIFFIHPSVDGHLSCLHVLATVNGATVNVPPVSNTMINLVKKAGGSKPLYLN